MTDYTVAAEFTLKDNVSRVLGDIVDRLDKATRVLGDFQERLDKLGGAGVNRLVRSLEKLSTTRFPTELVDGAARFEHALGGADGRIAEMTRHVAELAAAMKDLRVPAVPGVPAPGRPVPRGSGGGGHRGGDPIMEGIEGGAVLEFFAGNYERYSRVDQVYRAMQSDSNLTGNSPVMKAIRDQAGGQLDRYRALNPLDVAKNAAEAYTIGGGNPAEQSGLADMLDRAEQNLVLRGKSPEDAQRQAIASVRGLDVSNRFFNRQTGDFDMTRANAEMDRVQALTAASGGLLTGQQYLAFSKSSGTAGQGLTLEGLGRMAHLLDVNPSRTGTALKSFENLFGNGGVHMTDKNRAFWSEHGIFNQGKTVDSQLMRDDPLLWMQKHLGNFTPDQIDSYSQRQNVGSMINETRGATGNINRQAAAVARTDASANAANLLASPQGATIQFEASLEKFRVTLGKFEAGPGVKILDSLSSGLGKLDDVLEKHPAMTDALLKLTAVLAVVAVARGAAALTGLTSGLELLGKGLMSFAKGAPAEAALEGLTAASGAGSLGAFALRLTAVGAAVTGVAAIVEAFHKVGQWGADAAKKQGLAPYTGGGLGMGGPLVDYSHPTIQKQAYRSVGADPIHMQPIALTVTLDGRVITDTVEHHQTMRAMRPSPYGNAPDPMEVPFRPGTPYVSI